MLEASHGSRLPAEQATRILLVDDHELFRAGMRYLLRELSRPVEIVEVGSAGRAVEALGGGAFNLVLLDLVLPDCEAGNTLPTVQEHCGEASIVIVSMLDAFEDIRSALQRGAAGFIPKNSPPDVMRHAIDLVMSGGVYVPPAILRSVEMMGMAKPPRPAAETESQLSERQRAVLDHLGKGRSNKEIARALGLSEATVKVHVTALLRQLKAQNRVQLLLRATEQGLL